MAPHQLTVAEIPSHTHGLPIEKSVGGVTSPTVGGQGAGGTQLNTDAEGGGGTHGHTGSTFSGSALPGHQHTYNSNFPSYFKLAFIMFTG